MTASRCLTALTLSALLATAECSVVVADDHAAVRCSVEGHVGPPECEASQICVAGRCADCEVEDPCGDGIDNDCDGSIDENCASAPVASAGEPGGTFADAGRGAQ